MNCPPPRFILAPYKKKRKGLVGYLPSSLCSQRGWGAKLAPSALSCNISPSETTYESPQDSSSPPTPALGCSQPPWIWRGGGRKKPGPLQGWIKPQVLPQRPAAMQASRTSSREGRWAGELGGEKKILNGQAAATSLRAPTIRAQEGGSSRGALIPAASPGLRAPAGNLRGRQW